MKKKRKFYCLLNRCMWSPAVTIVLLIKVATGCTDTTPCSMEERTAVDFEVLSAPEWHLALQNVPEVDLGKEQNLVIRNQADFEKYVLSGTELPLIDFSERIVLCGRIVWHQCADLDTQVVQAGCGRLFYQVDINQTDCLASTPVYYFASVPKTWESGKINFEITVRK